MFSITQKGSFKNTERYLRKLKEAELYRVLDKYGALGVSALANATPVETGVTAGSWFYTIEQRPGYYSIRWHNSHEVNGTPLVVLLQYGHGTGTGGYVQGTDYIMPAVRDIFEQMSADIEREVRSI